MLFNVAEAEPDPFSGLFYLWQFGDAVVLLGCRVVDLLEQSRCVRIVGQEEVDAAFRAYWRERSEPRIVPDCPRCQDQNGGPTTVSAAILPDRSGIVTMRRAARIGTISRACGRVRIDAGRRVIHATRSTTLLLDRPSGTNVYSGPYCRIGGGA